MNSARIKAYLALAAAALIWGAAQPLIKPALSFVEPTQFLFLRYLIALPLALIALMFLFRRHRPTFKDLYKIIGIETLTLTNLFILYTGLKYTSALQSALILNTRPIFVTIMGIIIMREKEEKHEWLGLLLSVVGISLVIISPYLNSTEAPSQDVLIGNSLVILTNVIATICTFLAKRTYRNISKPFVGIINVIFGCFFFLAINLIQYQTLPLQALSLPSVLLPVLYMGLFGTMLAATLQIYGHNLIEVSEATLFHYLEPLVYVPLTILWLKESVSGTQMVGLFVIIAGVSLAAARLPKHRKRNQFHGIPLLNRLDTRKPPLQPAPLHLR